MPTDNNATITADPTTRPAAASAAPTRPIQRVIGGPRPVRASDAAELARLAVADTRTAQERVLDRVADRLAAAVAEPPPPLRLATGDGPRRTPPRPTPTFPGRDH